MLCDSLMRSEACASFICFSGPHDSILDDGLLKSFGLAEAIVVEQTNLLIVYVSSLMPTLDKIREHGESVYIASCS
jgi:hypothetical protein